MPTRPERRLLVELGYRSLLMLRLDVDGEPYGLIEIYDERRRRFEPARDPPVPARWPARPGKVVARTRMAERLEEAYFATLGALAAALEAKDAYTNDHASEIAELAGRRVRAAGHSRPARRASSASARCCTTSARSASPRRSSASPAR